MKDTIKDTEHHLTKQNATYMSMSKLDTEHYLNYEEDGMVELSMLDGIL